MAPRQRRRLGVLVGIALLVPVAVPPAASGDPLADKRAEAARIQDQLDAQGAQLSQSVERFNRARNHLAEVRASRARAEADVRRSDERMAEVKTRLRQVALAAYMQGGSTAVLSHMAKSRDHYELVVKRQYLTAAAGDQRAVIGELRSARQDLDELRGRLEAEERSAQAATDAADTTRRQAAAAEEAQRAILARVQGEMVELVAAENARRLAAEAARVPPALAAATPAFDDLPAPARPSPTTTAAPAASQPAPATAPGAATAVATAEAQVGKPYVWGGSGPDGFDCSGLTSYAWRAGGVSLPRDAYSQYFGTTRVPTDSVRPGDLLFFGSNGVESIHHVAIYVGNGQMVEASQTGVPVRYRGWRAGDLVGAGRPG